MLHLVRFAFLAFFYTLLPSAAHGYCWQAGFNPGFSDAPTIQQVKIDTVRISWTDIVEHRACVDQFLVKYWQKSAPHEYISSELVSPVVNYIDIKVVPKVPYQFQAVAREDKGLIRGINWNKSPIIEFRTSIHNQEVAMDDVPPNHGGAVEEKVEADGVDGDGMFIKREQEGEDGKVEVVTQQGQQQAGGRKFQVAGMSLETLVVVIVAGAVVLLVVLGLIFKLATKDSKARALQDEEDPEDNEAANTNSDNEDGGLEEKEDLAPAKNVS